MEPLIKDTGTVVEKFMELLLKKDSSALQKMFAQDGMVVDFEANSLRGAMIVGFLKDWPPRAVMVKREKTLIAGNMATLNLTLMGGGYAKPTPAKIMLTVNEAFRVKSARFQLGQG